MDEQRRKAAAAFGKDFMAVAKPPAPARNGAVASQTKANARPIPTYKDGGKVGKYAAGGIGKKRHGVPDPGRGPKLY